jgi:hypothetical protein
MALYRFSTTPVSRGRGDGALKRAAYNGRDNLVDERTGKRYDYSRKPGLEADGVFAPDNVPSWARDREKLWNKAAEAEDRSRRHATAREARDFKISLPHELNRQQREWLVKDFARYLVRKGMVVDWAIHAPDEHSDERHYHAHILTTTRTIDRDGFGLKNRDWNKVETLNEWRERFAEMGAKQLERAGFKLEAERYREAFGTLAEQRKKAVARGDTEHAEALNREPTKPMGPKAAAMEREDGLRTVRGNQNREIVTRNEERAKERKNGRSRSPAKAVAGRVAGLAPKVIGAALEAVGGAVESLFSPVLTPEERKKAERERLLREAEEEEATRRREQGRGRDR